ncbi:hypothetical protein JCM16358_06580 [Halanaerocella petrolearia]
MRNKKYSPPKSYNDSLNKPNLLKKYKQAKDVSLTIIQAKLGSGKSISIADFLKNSYEDNFYWYNVDKESFDQQSFWFEFIETYKDDIDFDSSLVTSLRKGKIEIKEFINQLINSLISNFRTDTFLVVDNFNLLMQNKDLLASITYFIDSLPDFLHMIVISRSKVNLPKLSYLKLKEKILLVEDKDFIFQPEEIKYFLKHEYDVTISLLQAKKIFDISEGWILALDVIGESLQSGNNLDDILANKNQEFAGVFDYLRYDLLEEIIEKKLLLKEFLFKTSVLRELKVDICNQLLDIGNSEEILDYLNKRVGFIYKIDDDRYKYHKLFNELLKYEARKVYDLELLHQQAEDIYKEDSLWEEFIYHNLKMNKEEKIIKLIINNYDKLIEEGRCDLLKHTLKKLSDKAFRAYPMLFICQGDIYCYSEEFSSGLESYLEAKKYFPDDSKGYIKALIKITELYFFLNSTEGLKYFNQLREYSAIFSPSQRRKIKKLNIIAKFMQGKIVKAQLLLRRLEDKDDLYYELKAIILFIKGEFETSKRCIEQVTSNKDRIFDYWMVYTLFLPLYIKLFTGQVYKCQDYVWHNFLDMSSDLKSLAEYYLLGIQKFLKVNKYSYQDKYEGLLNVISGSSFELNWFRLQLLIHIAVWEAFYGNPKQGIEYGKRGLEYVKNSQNEFYRGNLLIGLGINYYSLDKLDKAYQSLQQAKKIFSKFNNQIYLFYILLWLVRVSYKDKTDNKFEEYMRELLELTKNNSYDNLFLQPGGILGTKDSGKLIPLLFAARERGIEVDYINKLLNKMNLRERNRHPGYSLRISALGELEVSRGQEKITSDEWKRKKAKDLFKLLLVNQGQLISREKICYLLWPDKDKKAAERNFSVTLSFLNKVLEPNRKRGQTPFFIFKRVHSYRLNSQGVYYYDANHFRKMISNGKKADKKAVKINYYQQAFDLYQDGFLTNDLDKEWIQEEYSRLELLFLEIADELLKHYYQQQNYKIGLEVADKILKVNKCYESAYFYKMKIYFQLNRREYAIKVYHKCKETLKQKLSLTPNSSIKQYYRSITS